MKPTLPFAAHIADQTYIHKYNVQTNKWSQQFKYPLDWQFAIQSITMNKKGNKIYLSTHQNKLIIINTDTKKYHSHEYDKDLLFVPNASFNVNHKIHLIGNKHLIFDEQTNEFKQIHNFNLDYDYCTEPVVIYVPSKQIFISFMFKCVNNFKDYENAIWVCNLKTNQWHKHDTIITNKCGFCILRAVLTANQQFIIFIDEDFKLYVMDIRDDTDYKLSECSMKTPFKHRIVNMVRTGGGIQDEILVYGWIKKLFQNSKFKHIQLPPDYIMKLILKWYCIELIHFVSYIVPPPFFNANSNIHSHYAINVKHILLDAKRKQCMK